MSQTKEKHYRGLLRVSLAYLIKFPRMSRDRFDSYSILGNDMYYIISTVHFVLFVLLIAIFISILGMDHFIFKGEWQILSCSDFFFAFGMRKNSF